MCRCIKYEYELIIQIEFDTSLFNFNMGKACVQSERKKSVKSIKTSYYREMTDMLYAIYCAFIFI